MKRKNLLCLLLVLIMMLTFFSGCGSSTDEADAAEAETESAETTEEAEEADESGAETSDSGSALPDNYPMLSEDGSITISTLQKLNVNMAGLVDDYGELYWWQEVTARTGISFSWNMLSENIHPPPRAGPP